MKNPKNSQPKVRSEIARATWNQSGGGVHEKVGTRRRRHDRRSTRQALKSGRYDD